MKYGRSARNEKEPTSPPVWVAWIEIELPPGYVIPIHVATRMGGVD